MAASEHVRPDDNGLSKEALEKELASRKVEELREMGKRLSRSQESLHDMLAELESEQVSLREENTQLNSTIALMMQELQKLNISSSNCVEPVLDEGPLDFVGRFWEKVKPRDSAVAVSEHVGEIRKPVVAKDGGSSPNELSRQVQQVQERSKQVVQRLSGALGPWWQRAEGFLSQAQEEISATTVALAARAQQMRADAQQLRAEARRSFDASHSGGRSPQANGCANGSADEAEVQAAVAAALAPETPQASQPEPEAPAEVAPAPAPAEPEVVEPEAAEPAEQASSLEDRVSDTLLIEARLKIDDGHFQILQVRATDRIKEVAHKFVQEHSLKAWFEQPLTAWLKSVENDAVKFPVKVEADLLEIRKQFSKVGSI